jgi:hypothetical protein
MRRDVRASECVRIIDERKVPHQPDWGDQYYQDQRERDPIETSVLLKDSIRLECTIACTWAKKERAGHLGRNLNVGLQFERYVKMPMKLELRRALILWLPELDLVTFGIEDMDELAEVVRLDRIQNGDSAFLQFFN